ncbi:hypothetical protein SLEP1_g13236 [Rubroshorea leprosula]|uniref:Uncharacterized protein n=1 Tax=Rubroshorea leprosula TaxID=152421 RepID=A0AAV5IPA2_9ROSI|nr:hypothetical protein SLEP1_g13236 [Rubroshorea leprosula]
MLKKHQQLEHLQAELCAHGGSNEVQVSNFFKLSNKLNISFKILLL